MSRAFEQAAPYVSSDEHELATRVAAITHLLKRNLPMHPDPSAHPHIPLALFAGDDEDVAGRCAARLLITAPTPEAVESLARRIHAASSRAGCPLARTCAADFPVEPRKLREACSDALEAAAGGTLLITDVEEMPPIVQESLIDLLAELESKRARSAAARLVFGTTVSLLDRVGAGAFSERLFYRLNTIHLVAGPAVAATQPA